MAVEVDSASPESDPMDKCHLLMVQAASIVRYANRFLDAYKKKKNYIFVAIFIDYNGLAQRHLLFQREDPLRVREVRTRAFISLRPYAELSQVYCKTRNFRLSKEGDRVRFALELYNLASALDDESGDEDTERKVTDLKEYVDKLSRDHKMKTFILS